MLVRSGALKGGPDEHDDSLSEVLVLSVFECELGDREGCGDVD
jgi:hypothetical protein